VIVDIVRFDSDLVMNTAAAAVVESFGLDMLTGNDLLVVAEHSSSVQWVVSPVGLGLVPDVDRTVIGSAAVAVLVGTGLRLVEFGVVVAILVGIEHKLVDYPVGAAFVLVQFGAVAAAAAAVVVRLAAAAAVVVPVNTAHVGHGPAVAALVADDVPESAGLP